MHDYLTDITRAIYDSLKMSTHKQQFPHQLHYLIDVQLLDIQLANLILSFLNGFFHS